MRRPDWLLLLTTGVLTGIGLLVIHSTGGSHYLLRQLLFLPVAAGALAACYLLPRRVIVGLAWPLYLFSLLLLVAVLLFGRGAGASRWLVVGPFMLQPSELAKLSTVILLARWLSERREPAARPGVLTMPVLICLVPAALIVAEPDLSTAVLLAVLLAASLYTAGLKPLSLLLLFVPPLSFAAGFSLYTWVPLFIVLAVIFLRRASLGRALAVLGLSTSFGLLSPLVLSMLRDYPVSYTHLTLPTKRIV